MRLIEKILIVILIILITAVLLERSKENKEISLNIERLLIDKNVTTVDASKLISKDWDKICALGPYASAQGFKRQTGFDWNVELYTSFDSEDFTLLTFIKDNSVVEFSEYPIMKGSIINGCATNNKASLKINRSKDKLNRDELVLIIKN